MKDVPEVIEEFKKKYNFCEIKKSCANCEYMEWDTCDDGITRCAHPELVGRYANDYEGRCYIGETNNCVCDAWKPRTPTSFR